MNLGDFNTMVAQKGVNVGYISTAGAIWVTIPLVYYNVYFFLLRWKKQGGGGGGGGDGASKRNDDGGGGAEIELQPIDTIAQRKRTEARLPVGDLPRELTR